MKTKILGASLALLGGLILTTTSYAQTSSPSAKAAQRLAQQQANQQTRVQNGIQRGDTEINNRVNSLNGLVSRINDIKRLSATTKATLTAQVTSQISALQTLKTKIEADTDLTTLKADLKSILDSYRIYALFIPKTHILVASDGILQATSKFSDIETRLQTKIQSAQTAGKDVTSLNNALSDMQSKIADAQTQANNAVSVVTPLQPQADTSAYASTLKGARTDLQTGIHDLQTARIDAQTIISGLKSLGVNTATSSATTH